MLKSKNENENVVEVTTFYANIYVGLREQYTENIYNINDVNNVVDFYIKAIGGDCVTITPTQYRYLDGFDDGVIVGFINYPRFERSNEEITQRALKLGELLMKTLKQNRVSVVTPTKTFMLTNKEL
ncbi:hypothetical protein HYO65_gp112 [Tenacibaculum phage PTm1]|uniref:Uncharacterized protein n=2 Tax=Shirahamavirus PTm1 TaxID=2846435 RepID=A0A5S9C123_9CAUD|nr:hypothetical protein HYO65_gp112 [Tenacibaculum phage PTm1]BBI90504.1 hypothetical protein [Tenacibaculum phage PTm1]BBI90812.1 hypothetical protein [Tenacibaculum phage PTm5]